MKRLKFKKIFYRYYSGDDTLELVLQKLRNSGASQMQCALTLISELKIPLSKADNIVLNSKVWRDNFESTNSLRDDFFDAVSHTNNKE